jgi:hypothetical protein
MLNRVLVSAPTVPRKDKASGPARLSPRSSKSGPTSPLARENHYVRDIPVRKFGVRRGAWDFGVATGA